MSEIDRPANERSVEKNLSAAQSGTEVVVAVLTDNNEVLLTHRRSDADQIGVLFLPAASLTPHEEPDRAAARHLQEAYEYQAKQFDDLGALDSSSHQDSWQCHVFMARKLVHVPATRTEPAPATIEPMPLDKMDEFIQAGRLSDATTIAALHLVRKQLTAETNLTLWDVIVVSR